MRASRDDGNNNGGVLAGVDGMASARSRGADGGGQVNRLGDDSRGRGAGDGSGILGGSRARSRRRRRRRLGRRSGRRSRRRSRSRSGSSSLKTTGNAEGGGASSEIQVVGAAPGLGLVVVGAVVTVVARVTRAVLAAALLGTRVVAVRDAVLGRAVGEARAAGLSAGVAGTALGGLGVVTNGGAAHEAQAGHDGEAVGLSLGGSNGGHGGDGSDGGKVHLEVS